MSLWHSVKSRQRGTVCHNRLEHRLLARRIAQLDAGHEVGSHPVAGVGVGPDFDRLDQDLTGLGRIVPCKTIRHWQAVGGQEVA